MTIADLPAVNASLNAVATVLIIGGLICIKNGRKNAHRAFMISALIVSAAFLTCYLIHKAHYTHQTSDHMGAFRPIYLVILISHVFFGGDQPANDHPHGNSRDPWEIRDAQTLGTLDLSRLALCFRHRCGRVFHDLRMVPCTCLISMPLTIHLAETEAEAKDSLADLTIDYKIHQRIFSSGTEFYDLTLFYHLSDFYQDTRYIDGDVINLRGEVEEARKRIFDPRATELMSAFAKLCERALKARVNIFAFGE